MAVMRALESVRPARSRLFSDPLAPRFLSGRWRWVVDASRVGAIRRLVESVYDRVAGPGPRPSAVVRTRLIDDLVTDALSSVAQIVILGAGFDSRAYRLPGFRNVNVFEVDHPDTQRSKMAALRAVAPTSSSPVTFVPVDFERQDLAAALHDSGYRDDALSMFLWEGVTNYLTPAAVDATLAVVRRLSSAGSTLVFTYVHRAVIDGSGSTRFPEAARWVEGVTRRGEPWTFGLVPEEVRGFLSTRGFDLVEDLSTADAGARYFEPLGRRERGSALYHVVTASVA